MSECSYQSSLQSYYDGQAPPEVVGQIRQHLPACVACSTELRRLGDLSELLGRVRPESIRPDELARLHQAIEGVEDRGVLRLVGGLSAVAASILIISSAWLYDAPAPTRGTLVESAPPQNWERMASSGRADVPINVPQVGTARGDTLHRDNLRRDTTDWMVVGMGR